MLDAVYLLAPVDMRVELDDDKWSVVLVGAHDRDRDRVVAADPATGFVVVRVPVDPPVSPPAVWVPRRLDRPRVLIAYAPSDLAASQSSASAM